MNKQQRIAGYQKNAKKIAQLELDLAEANRKINTLYQMAFVQVDDFQKVYERVGEMEEKVDDLEGKYDYIDEWLGDYTKEHKEEVKELIYEASYDIKDMIIDEMREELEGRVEAEMRSGITGDSGDTA